MLFEYSREPSHPESEANLWFLLTISPQTPHLTCTIRSAPKNDRAFQARCAKCSATDLVTTRSKSSRVNHSRTVGLVVLLSVTTRSRIFASSYTSSFASVVDSDEVRSSRVSVIRFSVFAVNLVMYCLLPR